MDLTLKKIFESLATTYAVGSADAIGGQEITRAKLVSMIRDAYTEGVRGGLAIATTSHIPYNGYNETSNQAFNKLWNGNLLDVNEVQSEIEKQKVKLSELTEEAKSPKKISK